MNHEQINLLNIKEKEILEKAIEQFTTITGASLTRLNDKQFVKKGNNDADAVRGDTFLEVSTNL